MTLRSHRVARAAHERVAQRIHIKSKKEYGALAHKLPAMILQNGMAQATGFLLAKAKGGEACAHTLLLNDLAYVLHHSGEASEHCKDGMQLHRLVIQADTAGTMRLTRRGLEASGWLKRYVQGVLKVGATGEEANEGGTS